MTKIKTSNIPERVRKQWRDFFPKHKEIKSVVLFGSRARGDATERSDIDIAVSAPHLRHHKWANIRYTLREESPTLLNVDVVRWEKAPLRLKRQIQKNGKLLYERK